MSWDEAYKQLVRELGRKPRVDEIQERMFEIATRKLENQKSS